MSQELVSSYAKIVTKESDAKDIVERIMEVDSYARDCDTYLLLRYWCETTGKQNFAPINAMKHFSIGLTPPETVTRARRVIQNTEGRLLPTCFDVAVKRRIKESVLKEYYGRIN